MKIKFIYILVLTIFSIHLQGQSSFRDINLDSSAHLENRFKFAEMYFGMDAFISKGGTAPFLGSNKEMQSSKFKGYSVPRLTWGATHFWGHADIYLSFPLGGYKKTPSVALKKVDYNIGVETGLKIYPSKLQSGKLRPYIGWAWNISTYYQQVITNEIGITRFKNNTPILAGLSFRKNHFLLESGIQYYYDNKIKEFPISRTQNGLLEFPDLTFTVTGKYVFETTKRAKENIKHRVSNLEKKRGYNAFYVGFGPSSSTSVQSKSSFDETNYPFFKDQKRYFGLIPDITMGYFFC